MITMRSMEGYRATLSDASGPVVSIWAYTLDDAEYMAHEGNMRHYEAMADEETKKAQEQARLASEFIRQQVAEFRMLRARA